MAIAKVVYKSSASATPETWIDATGATASASEILSPYTAMIANGVLTTGTGTGGGTTVEYVTGSTPSITGVDDTVYICGECSTLSITAPAEGIIDVLFKSGTTATVLTVTSAKTNTTIVWPDWFDPTSLDDSTTYEINILNGEYGVVAKWV